jgi:hypothetical protein
MKRCLKRESYDVQIRTDGCRSTYEIPNCAKTRVKTCRGGSAPSTTQPRFTSGFYVLISRAFRVKIPRFIAKNVFSGIALPRERELFIGMYSILRSQQTSMSLCESRHSRRKREKDHKSHSHGDDCRRRKEEYIKTV